MYEQLVREWANTLGHVGSIQEWTQEEMSCSRTTFYEVLLLEIKGRLVSLQGGIDKDEKYKRDWLVAQLRVVKDIYGKNSERYRQCEESILDLDSKKLSEVRT